MRHLSRNTHVRQSSFLCAYSTRHKIQAVIVCFVLFLVVFPTWLIELPLPSFPTNTGMAAKLAQAASNIASSTLVLFLCNAKHSVVVLSDRSCTTSSVASHVYVYVFPRAITA